MHNNHTNFHREEKCLNCDVPLIGSFCSHCGQKAFLHKDSFWHMLLHFIGDYFHYDGKFWRTLKAMFTKPGLITLDYINGKRAKFLNPFSFYIFATTIFFIIPAANTKVEMVSKNNRIGSFSIQSSNIKNIQDSLNEQVLEDRSKSPNKIGIGNWTPTDTSFNDYLLNQNTLPSNIKDGWFKQLIVKKYFKINTASKDGQDVSKIFTDKLKANFPKVFFVLLPFFALLLSIFFRQKKYFYVDHAIHSLHLHTLIFIVAALLKILNLLISNSLFFAILSFLGILSCTIYFSISFKNIYKNGWFAILLKQIILFFLYLFGFLIFILGLMFILFLCL
jgi:Protein of unknown function (DUF3667)